MQNWQVRCSITIAGVCHPGVSLEQRSSGVVENANNANDDDADELRSLKQQLKSIRESMADMQADTPNISVGSPTNDVCHNIFEKCKTKIYPFDKVASMKRLVLCFAIFKTAALASKLSTFQPEVNARGFSL